MPISVLYVNPAVMDAPAVGQIQSALQLSPVPAKTPDIVYEAVSAAADPVQHGKEILYLTRNRGAFVRDCPGTRNYTCCGYRILHVGTYCSMDCSYCILQTYFHPPVMQFFVNHEDLFSELKAVFQEHRISRIGTGEFTDSLMWDRWTNLSPKLISRFSGQNRAVLELKTKTAHVNRLKDLDHRKKTVVTWSLNTDRVIHSEERRTAAIDARLDAAARCAEWGYPLGFHFDPMVLYKGCETDYRNLVNRLFNRIPPHQIAWISMGSFRFPPSLLPVVEHRFPASNIIYGEFVRGLDGKMRYFKPLRIRLYRRVVNEIRRRAPEVLIYFCMEDDEVWHQTMGFTPSDRGGLNAMLDGSAVTHCGLDAALLK